MSDKREQLIRAVKAWWRDPYWEVTCIRHGTVQVARTSIEEESLIDRCPLCRTSTEHFLVEPPAEQRLR